MTEQCYKSVVDAEQAYPDYGMFGYIADEICSSTKAELRSLLPNIHFKNIELRKKQFKQIIFSAMNEHLLSETLCSALYVLHEKQMR